MLQNRTPRAHVEISVLVLAGPDRLWREMARQLSGVLEKNRRGKIPRSVSPRVPPHRSASVSAGSRAPTGGWKTHEVGGSLFLPKEPGVHVSKFSGEI